MARWRRVRPMAHRVPRLRRHRGERRPVLHRRATRGRGPVHGPGPSRRSRSPPRRAHCRGVGSADAFLTPTVTCPRGHVTTAMTEGPEYPSPCTGGPRAGGPMAAAWGRRWVAQGSRCAAARSLSGQPNLAGFCRDFGGIRDKAPNSGSYTPIAPRVQHITNIQRKQRYRCQPMASRALTGTRLFQMSERTWHTASVA